MARSSLRKVPDIVGHLRRFYGREASPRKVDRVVAQVFGNRREFTRPEALEVLRRINLRRLPLTSEMKEKILDALRANQGLPPIKRRSFSEIAKEISPHVSISNSMLKKLNDKVRRELLTKGKKPTRFVAKARMVPQNIVKKVEVILAENHKAPLDKIANALSISNKQLITALSREGSSLDSLRSKAIKEAISRKIAEHGSDVTNEQLAEELGLSVTTITGYRGRRGRGSGVAVVQKRVGDNILRWLGALTKPFQEGSSIVDLKVLVALTGASELTCRGAISALERDKLIVEQEPNRFVITSKGFGVLMRKGVTPRNPSERVNVFSIRDLEKIRDRVSKAGLMKPQIAQLVLVLNELIRLKEIEEIKRKLT